MMSKIALLLLAIAFTTITGNSNFACTRVYGGYCSHSKTCSDLGGRVEKLPVNCGCSACCKCTDTCAEGSVCINEGEGETCNGIRDTKGCCGHRVCCTAISTTPGITSPNTTPECIESQTSCLMNYTGSFCGDSCTYEIMNEDCCGKKCCSETPTK
ncbi:keratin-associated protein 5-5-like [Mytilus edulis]|uniref:keratin-associated protein 5-5-like n=1 Tax=Mytilus edulis TaxID=6550 RepID=UPI0039EF4846